MKAHEFARAERDLRRVRSYLADGQIDAAQASAESLNRAFPELAIGWFWRSLVHMAQNQMALAIGAAERAVQIDDQRAEVHSHLARCHLARGDAQLARQSAERALALAPDDAALLDGIGSVLAQVGESLRAHELHARAVAAAPENISMAMNLGQSLRQLGRDDEACKVFEQVVDRVPQHGHAHWAIAHSGSVRPDANHLERLDAARRDSRPGSIESAWLDFARFKEFDDLGLTNQAIAALLAANDTMRGRLRFSAAADVRLFELLELGAADVFGVASAQLARSGPGSAPVPIFVLGMPRSGTSLVERLLGNHPEVRLGGELQDFNVCIKRELGIDASTFIDERVVARLPEVDLKRNGEAYRERLQRRFGTGGYVTDKLPGNYAYVAAIAAALPEARIVHMVRDPMDNCFAIFKQMLGPVYPYAYDQEDLAGHYVRYARFMRRCESALPQRVFPLRYEHLVSVPALITRQLYRYCGLDWVDGAEQPAGNAKPVATARPVQVRDQIDARGIGAWESYAPHLVAMRTVLAGAGLVPREQAAEAILRN